MEVRRCAEPAQRTDERTFDKSTESFERLFLKLKMLDKNLCVIWPELVSCGGENPQKKDLTNEDNVVELLKKETCTETFQEKMNKIINQRYIYYPYLIKPADLMLARLMYDLVRKKDLRRFE